MSENRLDFEYVCGGISFRGLESGRFQLGGGYKAMVRCSVNIFESVTASLGFVNDLVGAVERRIEFGDGLSSYVNEVTSRERG